MSESLLTSLMDICDIVSVSKIIKVEEMKWCDMVWYESEMFFN